MAAGIALVLTAGPAAALPGPEDPAARHGGSPGYGSIEPAESSVGSVRRAFPVRGATSYSAAHHDYPATDIFASCGRRVVAPVTGTVLEFSRRDRWDPSTDRPRHRGGRFIAIRGDDGVRYYGSHLGSVAPTIKRGARVWAGERIGRVGRSGNARYTSCHLHFGLSPLCQSRRDWWIRRGTVGPYRFLRAWEDGEPASPRRAVRRWQRDHGCPSTATLS